MNTELDKLCYLYKNSNSKNKYISDNSEIIEYNEKLFDDYTIFITYILSDNHYLIFVNIGLDNKLIFNGLLYESESNLKNKYSILLYDLHSMTFENFITKYYKILKDNF